MKKKIALLSILSVLCYGCTQNNIEVGKINNENAFEADELSYVFKESSPNVYMFAGEIQPGIYNSLSIVIKSYQNDELIATEKKSFDLKPYSNNFNVFLGLDLDKHIINICVNSDQLFTYWRPLESSEINNEYLFKAFAKENTIYSHGSSNYSEEIILGSLKNKNNSQHFDICIKLEFSNKKNVFLVWHKQ